MKPLISVILPVFNREEYIIESVESILKQTYTKIELIIIDDASNDETVKIISQFYDSRIQLIKNKINLGVAASTNLGIRKAKGKYIAKMDSDDIALPTRLETQLTFMEENEDIIVCGSNIEYFGAKKKIIKYKENHKAILVEMLLRNPFANPTVIIRKEIFDAYLYDESYKYGEDYEFWTRIGWEGKMYNIQEVLLLYRVHSKQLSSDIKNKRLEVDISLKLRLFHMIKYDNEIFKDEFIKRILFSNEAIELQECAIFLKWLNNLLLVNIKQPIFDQKELTKILETLKRNFVYDLFFTNKRNGIDYLFRLKILLVLPINEIFFVLKKKMIEKFKSSFR
ncbi:glycosyltransferase family 2 protein [Gillisia hiemivivida]|uniref:Glycosyltransferase n=1 Tax=Gillisia hiemivivida TaxID=291190 RepID=A0A5C6ZV49_9FLAO|nr:glycosyltransferase [Gillisia hiemivivida]TXD93886.1 glycosyltransferase [Gillisia hiemivivida]